MARTGRDGIRHTAGEDVIARVAGDPTVAGACRLLLGSNAAGMALEAADALGYRIVQADLAPEADSRIDRHRRLVELRRGLAPAQHVAALARELGHVRQDAGTVLAAHGDLPLDERLAGTYLVEADADAFQVHVAAQLARSGSPALWSHCAAHVPFAAEAYRHGCRKGGERLGTASAFEAQASDPGFLDRHAGANAAEIADGSASHGPGDLNGLSRRLALASPAGTPYPGAAFAAAVRAFEARADERPSPAPAMRNAA